MSEVLRGPKASEDAARQLTSLLRKAGAGEKDAKQQLYERIYDDLRKSASRVLRKSSQQELQTTDLVHEVLLRFEATDALSKLANRRVFFAVAIRAMQQILVDHYRRRKKLVDSPNRSSIPLEQVVLAIEHQVGYDLELLQLGLEQLERDSPRQYAVLNYRIFGGLSIVDTAELLDVSRQTVERDWRLARAKLFRFMIQREGK